MATLRVSRRALLAGGLAATGALLIGFESPLGAARARAQGAGVFAPNQWIRIDRDGVVTIVNSVPEMGQGSLTTMPMIVADELDADLGSIRVEQAPADPKLYANPVTGNQSYGGSRGVRDHLAMLRKAGAAAHEMLMQAAAQEWGVSVSEVTTEPGVVVQKGGGRRLTYGQLVDRAATLPVPQNPTVKTRAEFRYIGKEVSRRDTPIKVNGSGVYGMDVRVPDMLVASIERCPVFGGKVTAFDAAATKKIPGVRHVAQVSHGVAVVADTLWIALQGRRALKVTYDAGPMAQVSSARIEREYAEASKQPGQEARKEGDAEAVLASAARTVEAVYQVPFLEHACMEPMNATAHVRADACEIWAPTQNPGGAQAAGARLTGLPASKVTVHTTLLGGGFGRRGELDFIVDAVETAKAVGVPVKVMWTREDDIQHGFYRPATYNVFRAALDQTGKPTAWWSRVVGPGILIQQGRGHDHRSGRHGVSVNEDGRPRVHRIVAAIDCGIAVNPDQVRAQMEGGAIYALTAALYGEITIDGGRVKQSNFHDYPLLRMAESPAIEAYILDSGEPPGGLGEPGVPTVAPAVCNAIFALTGKRIRRLPIRVDELKRT